MSVGCGGCGNKLDECTCPPLPPTAEAVLREFVEWFDARFPKGGKSLPGLPLYTIAEKAREALDA